MNAKKAKALRQMVRGYVERLPNLPPKGLEAVTTRKMIGRSIPANWTQDYIIKLARLCSPGSDWFAQATDQIVLVYAQMAVNRKHSPRWLYRRLKRGS